MKKLFGGAGFLSFTSSLLAIVIGLLFGLIILLFTNAAQALPGFGTIVAGGFAGGMKGLGDVLYFATPLIMTGLSIGFAFKTGLFNIGAAGQFAVGSFGAVLVSLSLLQTFGPTTWVFALLAGLLFGAIWGFVPGMLKAFLNVNEVIATIMMNYIGIYFVNMMVKTSPFMYDQLKNQTRIIGAGGNIPNLGLNEVFRNVDPATGNVMASSSINAGIFIAIGFAILVYIIINKTTFGFELRACGLNRNASRYAGINEKRSIVMSMVIAGALAGLGGALLLLAGSGKHIQVVDVLPSEGFMGIPIALLGLSNPIGIIFSGLFIAHIQQGGFYMQLYNFVPEIISIIIAAIVYCSALSLLVKKWVTAKRNARLNEQLNRAEALILEDMPSKTPVSSEVESEV